MTQIQALTDMVTGVPIPPGALALVWLLEGGERECSPYGLPVPAYIDDAGVTLALDTIPEAEDVWGILKAILASHVPDQHTYRYPTTLADALDSANGTGPYLRLGAENAYAWGAVAVETYLDIVEWAKVSPTGPWSTADHLIRTWLDAIAAATPRNPDPLLWPAHWGGLREVAPWLQRGDQAVYHALMGAMALLQFMRYCSTPLQPSRWVAVAPSRDQYAALALRARLASRHTSIFWPRLP